MLTQNTRKKTVNHPVEGQERIFSDRKSYKANMVVARQRAESSDLTYRSIQLASILTKDPDW